MLAAAYTSGLTPCSIWAASSSEPAKENFASAASNSLPYAVNAVFSEAAADTVRPGLPASRRRFVVAAAAGDEDERGDEDQSVSLPKHCMGTTGQPTRRYALACEASAMEQLSSARRPARSA